MPFRPVTCEDEQRRSPAASGRAAEEIRAMITAIVSYKLPPHIDLAACAAHFPSVAPGFGDVPGLIRKQFIYAEDGWAGGVYMWQMRAAPEAFCAGPWLDGIRERYGMDLQIRFFETACITDNASEAVLLPDATRVGPTAAVRRGLR
jgi:hypothetical protein